MKDKIVMIDGHSILNRAFYGLPELTNAEGIHTNAVYGFLNILFRIIEEEKPQYLTVAFDLSAPTFRHKMYPEYKGTRHPMPEELKEQVPLMKEVLASMGVYMVSLEGFEADDLLGTLARKSEEKGMEVTVVSGDRDLLQLATEHTQIRIPKTKFGKTVIEDYHAEDVMRVCQISPAQVVELKALMGDSADNIPGIPGVGVKTATAILQKYATMENAHEHLEEIKPRKAMESLRDHYDLACLSRKLAQIDTDCPVTFDYQKAKLGNLYTREAYLEFKKLEFRRLLPRFDAETAEVQKQVQIHGIHDLSEADRIMKKAVSADQIGIYLLSESNKISEKTKICGLALSFTEEETYYIPAEGFVTEEYIRKYAGEIMAKVPEIGTCDLKSMLEIVPVGERKGITDIRIAAYLLNPLKSDYPCDGIARSCHVDNVPSAEEIFSSKKIPAAVQMKPEEAARYAGFAAYTAEKCRGPLLKELEENGMLPLFQDIEMPLVFVLHDMEKAGIVLQSRELETYGDLLQKRIGETEKKIYDQAGEEFNINSPKQLGVILFEKMQLPGGKKTKTGYSTAADVLEKLAADVPFVADIMEYRQLTKLKSTYADTLGSYVAPDGRIHSTFHQTITATGRISSTDPNLQNIPVRMELGREIRKLFVASEGCVFIDADYSQIELRVLAHMSGDKKLIDAYKQQKDIHAITASQVFHVPFDQVTPLQRRNAKAVNFGIVYGISSFGLSQGLSISRKEAAGYIEKYFETYPGIKIFLDRLVADAKKKGYSETMYGRRRPMPELASANFMQRQFGERVAMNAPIQGTAADIIKIAMIRVNRRLKKENRHARLILQVHDELLIEAPVEEIDRVSRLLEEEMTGAAELAVKLEVDLHTGENWYAVK